MVDTPAFKHFLDFIDCNVMKKVMIYSAIPSSTVGTLLIKLRIENPCKKSFEFYVSLNNCTRVLAIRSTT
jgi:hypothetical protein